MFTPPMPGDVMVNFYINLSKLCLTVYQLHVVQPNTTKARPECYFTFMKTHPLKGVFYTVSECVFTDFFFFICLFTELQASGKLSVAQPWSYVVSSALLTLHVCIIVHKYLICIYQFSHLILTFNPLRPHSTCLLALLKDPSYVL